jgi:CHAD domain-containing protein
MTEMTAHELLSSALRAHIETVRKTMARVLSTTPGVRRGGPAKEANEANDAKEAPAEDDDAEEAVHDFRVGMRRLRTALRTARKIYGRKRLRAIGDGLKRYGDVTSALRDEEVLRVTLAKLQVTDDVRATVTTWLARRAKQERVRRGDVVRLLRSGAVPAQVHKDGVAELPSLEECLARLEKRLDRPKRGNQKAVDLGHRALADAKADIDAMGQVDAGDVTGMHTLRIRFKRLRYTAELFVPALAEEAEATAKAASRLQSKLGDLHDLDQALVRMARARGLSLDAREAVLEALQAARTAMAQKCVKELAAWREADAQRTIERDRATKSYTGPQ